MPRPRIGITMEKGGEDDRPNFELPGDYPKAIENAGGLPVFLPWAHNLDVRNEMLDLVDALLIPGGSDIDPSLYGQEKHPETRLTGKDRLIFDFAMLSLAEQRKMPALGICLGCQVFNVHRRGTLHQHLPEVHCAPGTQPLDHRRKGDRYNMHEVAIRPGTKLAEMMHLDKLSANSRHHQGIDKLGHGLIVNALATDGLVEGIEDPSLPFWVAVQWHPENLFDTEHERLFEGFVRAAEDYRRGRNGD